MLLFFILCMGAIFVEVAQTIILPAFSTIAKELHATASQIQLTHAAFFLGAILANSLCPFFSHLIGFDRSYLTGLLIATIISLLSFFFLESNPSLFLLYPLRFIQGFGTQLVATINQVLVIHYFKKDQTFNIGMQIHKSSAQMFSLLFVLLSLSGILAPILGSYMMEWSTWQATFLISFVLSLLIYGLTLKALPFDPEIAADLSNFSNLKKHFLAVLTNRSFFYTASISCSTTLILLTYFVESPYLFIDQFQLSAKEFAYCNIVPCSATIIGSLLAHRFSKSFSQDILLKTFCRLLFLFALIFLFSGLIFGYGPIQFLSISFPFFVCCGALNPIATSVAFKNAEGFGAVAGSFMNFYQMVACLLGTLLGALLPKTIPWSLAICFAAVSLLILLLKNRSTLPEHKA